MALHISTHFAINPMLMDIPMLAALILIHPTIPGMYFQSLMNWDTSSDHDILHACVWGPNKNTAIDNCNAVEGSCSPGFAPIKGTNHELLPPSW